MQDEEQEWDPSAADFMAICLRIIQTEAGNATVGSVKRHGDGDDDNAGSDISLLTLYSKGIHDEGLFLNLDRPAMISAATGTPPRGRSKLRKRPSS